MKQSGIKSQMPYKLSDQEYSDYLRDGYLVRESVFDKQEVAGFRQASEKAAVVANKLATSGQIYILDGKKFVDIDFLTVQYESGANSEAIRVIEPAHQLDPVLDALVDDERLTQPMLKLVGVDAVALWTDKLNLKQAKSGSGFTWHQDAPYWIHDCAHVDQLPNVYLALDDASQENGCFQIIKSSHTQGCLPGTVDGSQLGGFYTDPQYIDASQRVDFEVPAGSLVFFNAHSIHGSEANNSDQARGAFILTYQPANFPMLKSGEVRNV